VTWEAVAAEHLNHRCVLRDSRTLECVDCHRKLILPKDAKGSTPIPTPYRAPAVSGRPRPEGWKQRVVAELAARKRQRTTVVEES
jgi:hypothetical protein